MTENLATGHVYYRFNDIEEYTFQSYFTDTKATLDVNKKIVSKAKKNTSNGQFYFNGAQIFNLDKRLIDDLPFRKANVASLGVTVDLKRNPVNISLGDEAGDNILFFGINAHEQVTRTVMNALYSIIYTARKNDRELKTYVIDALKNDDAKYKQLLEEFENDNLITLVSKKEIGSTLYAIASGIKDGGVSNTLLLILGQENIRALKLDNEINIENNEVITVNDSDAEDLGNFEFDKKNNEDKDDISTYRKALSYILDNGPESGVNTLLQIDDPRKLLYEDYVTNKYVCNKFNHLVMLRSDEKISGSIGLKDTIKLEVLSSDTENLRAIYYNTMEDSEKLFTPYLIK